MLWNNGNDTCSTTDCGVKTDEAKSCNNLQQKIPIKGEDNKNTYNNNDSEHCIVEINGNHRETNNERNDLEKQNKGTTDDKRQLKHNEVPVEILHHGKYFFMVSIKVSLFQKHFVS